MDSVMLNDLAAAFCEDCTERMRHVTSLMRVDAPLDGGILDQLHQEFDTLFGGARAVHRPALELFFRGMARYARYLRNRLISGQPIDPAAWQDLWTGIRLAQLCGSDQADCLEYRDCERLQLLQAINNRIDNGERT